MKKRSKRYKKLKENFDPSKTEQLGDIINKIKKEPNIKFDESIDGFVRINIKQIKGDFSLRNVVNLPHGNGKKIKIAVLCEPGKIDEAKKSGAEIIGSDDLIDQISKGKINFDKLISTSPMMSKIGKLGKILGPKGKMPNPKLGTVTNDIIKSVKLLKSGQIEMKNDKDGNIGVSIGKKSFPTEKIVENYNTFVEAVIKERPKNIKGNFLLSSYISSTMGLSYKVKIKNI